MDVKLTENKRVDVLSPVSLKPRRKGFNVMPMVFVGPHLLLFALFFLIPIFFGVYISFTNWDLINTPEFVGLDNYKEILLTRNPPLHPTAYGAREHVQVCDLYGPGVYHHSFAAGSGASCEAERKQVVPGDFLPACLVLNLGSDDHLVHDV